MTYMFDGESGEVAKPDLADSHPTNRPRPSTAPKANPVTLDRHAASGQGSYSTTNQAPPRPFPVRYDIMESVWNTPPAPMLALHFKAKQLAALSKQSQLIDTHDTLYNSSNGV
jgi:hypothetical protein